MSGLVSSGRDMLFGTSGRAPSVHDVTPSQFRDLRQPLADQFQALLAPGGIAGWQGATAAPMGGAEQDILSRIMGQMGQQPGTQQAQQTLMQTAGGQFLDPASNPFLAASIEAAQRPLIQQFQEEVVPGMRADFTRAGQTVQGTGSSPFQMAAARASSGFADALGDIGTRMASENFQQERTRQLQAASALPGVDRAQLESLMAGLEAQALPRMIEQMGIDRGMAEFQRQQNQLLQVLAMATGAASPQPVSLPGTPAQPGMVQTGAEAFLRGLGQSLGGG
jgi:hypothetical protein